METPLSWSLFPAVPELRQQESNPGVNVSALPELAGLVERPFNLACSIACPSWKILPGFEVSLQDSANYTSFTNSYWSAQQVDVNPYCVFKPSIAKQVSTAVLISRLTRLFKDWDITTVQDSTGLHTLPELVTLMSAGIPDGVRETYWDVTFKLDRPLFSFLLNTFYELLPDVISAENLIPTVSIQLLTVPRLDQMQKHGGNAFGLSLADGPLFIMSLGSMWTNPADDHRIFKFQHDFITKVQAEAEKKGLNNDYIYMN
ncbi:hypothetical protein E8E11_009699 [Didymella keratinophila]|nr:hypothetical protein E8E11_009699 [Didymella keratinophila]